MVGNDKYFAELDKRPIQQDPMLSTQGPTLLDSTIYTVGMDFGQESAYTMDSGVFRDKKFYHLQNEGIERRIIFSSKEDFDRFEAYLYLLNAVESQRAANFFVGGREGEIFTSARGENLVAIGAYSFLPQEFHLLVTPHVENGIGKFMQKLQTAYTMYFNKKYQRSGRLFHSAYRSGQLESDERLKQVFGFIHLNPARLFDVRWDESSGSDLMLHARRAIEYRYSSAGEYQSGKHIITEPAGYPQYIRRAKDAHANFQLWTRNNNAQNA